MSDHTDPLRRDARAIFDAAVAGVEPGRALGHALATTPPPERVRILALGKAAAPMAGAAAAHLDRLDIPITGGLVVTADDRGAVDSRLPRIVGDHPLPGPRSLAAAEALGEALALTNHHEEAWVLLSGGTSSLIGAPEEGLDPVDYHALMGAIGRAGLSIGALNRIRKRFSRWGAGRLAVACRTERLRVFAISDVPGDAPADIGSGPCEPDPTTAAEIREALRAIADRARIPNAAWEWLERVIAATLAETPKPGDPAVARVITRIVASNRQALEAAGAAARSLGYRVHFGPASLAGEASVVGRDLARSFVGAAPASGPEAWLFGGETTVTLDPRHGRGGRCQELALAAARELGQAEGSSIVLLAAGTDGRDGPTDAAGAAVDHLTWREMIRSGLDPARSLEAHDAYQPLDRVGALERVGPTGTNVMDIVVVLRSSDHPR